MRRARTRRRLVRDGLFAAVGVGATGLATSMLAGEDANAIATVASLFVGIASLLLALADFFRPAPTSPDPAEYADDLARTLKGQWLEEAEARRLRDPRVLPLAWAATARGVADEPRVGGVRVVRHRLDGRLTGRFEQVTSQLAEGYDQLAQGRLVVIGEPGAGKTVLALLLTLGLLDARAPGTPVPVLLPVSSWDPLRERLDDWIVNSLAVPHYSGRPEIPRTLLAHGLLLPVLDGLDEIPESARRGAIRGINHAVGGERPVVVTCRSVEYEELIRGGAPRLRQAPVVEVLPVPPADVVAYLRDTEWPEGVVWDEVFARLSAEPDGPPAEALSTPMMVTTARLVYQRGGADPRELLDRDRFDCRYAVEDHLTHEVVDAAYTPDPRSPEEAGVRQRWRPEQARRWLTFLAGYLHDHRERDLAWWSMSGRLLPRWVGSVAALLLGLVVAFGASVWVAVTEEIHGAKAFSPVVALTLAIGAGFALIGSIVWYMVGDPLPGRLVWSPQGSAARLRRGFRSGVVLCVAFVVPVAGSVTLILVLDSTLGPGTLQGAEAVATLLAVCVAIGTVMGLSLAAHSWLNAPPSRATQVNPANSLAQDRRSALCGALVAGAVFGATGLLGLQLGLLGGGLLFRLVNDWPGWPGDGETGDYAEQAWRESSRGYGMEHFGFGVPYLLPATLFALLVLLSRAWPRFVLTRLWLAARGRLPWRLMEFLADARRREILRQSGGAYQFRHIRLQEALAGRPTYDEPGPSAGRWESAVVRRRVVLAAGVAAALSGTGAVIANHRDESEVTFWTPAGTWVTTLAFRPGTGEVFWGDYYGRIWSGSRYGRQHRVAGAPPPYKEPEGYDGDVAAYAMAFHPDGGILALQRGGRLQVWDVRERQPERVYSGPLSEPVASLAFAPDGDYLIGVPDGDFGVFRRQVDADGQFHETKHFLTSVSVGAVCFLPKGGLAVLHEAARVRMHTMPELDSGQSLNPNTKVVGDGGTYSMTASPRGDFLLVRGDEGSQLWQLLDSTWEPAGTLPAMTSAAFHPTAPVLAFGRATDDESSMVPDGTIELRTVPAWAPVPTLHGHMSEVTCMTFDANGDWLATGSNDGTVRLWDTSRLKP
ncbi:NACHT domain-containing protein [Streptomyces spinoverrucosus]|uniref:WD40 repeat domain-containing protein n=1 Tax=Streptomyces spinoverrucosus TaxID=284043 RepID=UPI0018C355BE|nr:WD40 repeat domain-containing protein [Streptomyces spinoverrucosus]MBG0853121.1 NACHT domain-containing protein [Streptomyces spinoverrucosus]